MSKIKKLFTNWRILLLLSLVIAIGLIPLKPNPFREGAAIRSVEINSSASLAGIQNPKPGIAPMSREVILAIDNQPIKNADDYYDYVEDLEENRTIQIKTNRNLYRLSTKEKISYIQLNETEEKIILEAITRNETINGTIIEVNKTTEKRVMVPKTIARSEGVEDLGLKVFDAPKTNLRKGLDLQGGTRVLLQPEEELADPDLDALIDNMKERLNVFGLSDLTIRKSGDLSGNQYILVEIAGANEEEVKDLLSKQGKFEAKISNETVFVGGRDITYVCRSADCSGIDPSVGCGQVEGGWTCRFRFSISLLPGAAEKQAEVTKNLKVITENRNQFLSEQIILYLDDVEVDRLNIGAELKGKAVTDIQISGGGFGQTSQEATYNTLANMKRLQTILITGSLPVKLNIIKTDTISPILGEEFMRNAIFLGIFAIVSVFVLIFIRYRMLKVSLPMALTITTELIMLLGVASLIGWNLDLAAIAAIIVSIGTGIDHQIVITDETLRGQLQMIFNWKERFKSAFKIILIAFATVFVAMIPLLFAGAGLLKGFALITMIGATLGVFVSRPAYAAMIEILLKE